MPAFSVTSAGSKLSVDRAAFGGDELIRGNDRVVLSVPGLTVVGFDPQQMNLPRGVLRAGIGPDAAAAWLKELVDLDPEEALALRARKAIDRISAATVEDVPAEMPRIG